MADRNMDTTTINTEQSLATLSPDGDVPKSRLANAALAYELYRKMRDADKIRSEKRAKMQGIVDGNEPWTQADTERSGQGWRSRINPRTGEAIRDAREAAYFDMIEDADTYVDIKLKPEVLKDYPQYGDDDAIDFGEIMAEEHRKVNVEWPDFLFEMFQHQDQMVMWASGNCYFPDEWDWRFKAARVGQLLVPDETQCKLGDFEVVAIRSTYRVHELYDKIRTAAKRKASEDIGWDTKLIEKILIEAVSMQKSDDRYQVGDFESWQQMYQNAEYYYDYSAAPSIQIVHLLWKEFDGKISHGIICENEAYNKMTNPENTRTTPSKSGYLFFKNGRYDAWENCLVLFFLSFGNGTYHSIRGLAHRISVICWEEMKQMNGILDASKLSNSVMLQPNNQAHKTAMAISRFGPWSILESGYNIIQQNAFRPDMTGSIAVLNLLDNTLNRNIGKFPANINETDKTAQSAQTNMAIKANEHKEVKLEEKEVKLYYKQLTPLWREQIRRLLSKKLRSEDPGGKEAIEFRERCLARGVPELWLDFDNLEVSARSVIGPTSPMLRSMILGENLSRSPYFDERGKRNALRDATVALVGCRHADRYVTKASRNQIPTQEKSFASMENTILAMGGEVIVGTDQNHVEHDMVHFAPLEQIVDMMQKGAAKGMNLEKVHTVFQMGLSHIANHLEFLKGDPAHQAEFQADYGKFQQMSQIFVNFIDKPFKAQQKAQQQQAEQHQQALAEAQSSVQDPALVAKLQKVKGDLQIKAQKEQATQQLKEMKTEADLARKDRMASHAMDLADRKADRGQ